MDVNAILRIQNKANSLHSAYLEKRMQNLPFGAYYHRFELNPPLPLREIEAFEAQHGIELPADYRRFLLEIGNGGAGPYYGISPLSKWDYAYDEEEEPNTSQIDVLALPCPLTPRRYEEDWYDHLNNLAQGPYQGTISICHQGCTYAALLIVTGEARGRVVNADMDSQPPKFAPFPDFMSWYEAWQDLAILDQEQPGWFGFPREDA